MAAPGAALPGGSVSRWGRGGAGDGGFATVWAAGVIMALTVVAGFGVLLGSAVVTRHRAEAAADLAALAGAGRAVDGERWACDRARWVADRMRVEVVGCRVDGFVVSVVVVARPTGVLAGVRSGRAVAVAGPV